MSAARECLFGVCAALTLAVAAPARSADCAGVKVPFAFTKPNKILTEALDRRLREASLGKSLDAKRLAVSFVDLSSDKRAYYAGVNDNEMMYAASLPKIVALLGVVEAAKNNQLEWTHAHDVKLSAMITESDNAAASWATDLVGLPALEALVRDPRYCFYDNAQGGLWLGRAYRKSSATNRDPLKQLIHGATTRQAARFFAMLRTGMLVDPHWSFRMLGLMAPPRKHHKFVEGLADRAGVTFLARKSGTWRTYHSDGALIQHGDKVYAAVALSDLKTGESVMRTVIRIVDDLVMQAPHLNRKSARLR